MAIPIGDDVSKIYLGDQTLYDREVANSSWIECPNIGAKKDFVGLTIMQWDKASKTATFRSNALCMLSAIDTASAARIAIGLPFGFKFSIENPSTTKIYSPSMMTIDAPTVYQGNIMTVSFADTASAPRTYGLSEASSRTSDGLFTAFKLNVEKE